MNLVTHDSPLGVLTLYSNGAGLTGLYFEDHAPKGARPAGATQRADAVLDLARRELDAYFAGRRRAFETPVRPTGTPFSVRVWARLQDIRCGETASYGAIAAELDAPAASRAVGAAVGRNPVSIIVPCHRVVGAAGALTGYAGGLARKRALLALESGQAVLGMS